MNKVQRSVLVAVRPVLDQHGATCWLDVEGRGHNYLVITLNGVTRRVPFASSPKDRDTMVLSVARQVRRILADFPR